MFSALDPLRSGTITLHDFYTSVTIAVIKSNISVSALLKGAKVEFDLGLGIEEGFSEKVVLDCLSAVCCSPESAAAVADAIHEMYRYYFHQRVSGSKSYLHPSISIADNTLLCLDEIDSYVRQSNLLVLLQEEHRKAHEEIHSKIELNRKKG